MFSHGKVSIYRLATIAAFFAMAFSFHLASAATPVVNKIQGYNPATNGYTDNTALLGTYISLYGSFAPASNTVLIDNLAVGTSYQSSTQINAPLGSLGVGSHNAKVQNSSGDSFPMSFTVIAHPSADLTINGSPGGSFTVGEPWVLTATSEAPNAGVSICAVYPDGTQGCTPAANLGETSTTDPSGNWSASGSFPSSTIGPWQEWLQLNYGGTIVTSTQVTFTVANGGGGTTPSTTASFSINGAVAGSFTVGQSWNLSLISNATSSLMQICALGPTGVTNCASATSDGGPAGTNVSGDWSGSGTFSSSSVGAWQEWAQISYNHSTIVSNRISFTVNPAGGGTYSATLTINGTAGTQFTVGQSSDLGLVSNMPNSPVTICAVYPNNTQGCTPAANLGDAAETDSSGNWSASSVFSSSTVGAWQEWAEVNYEGQIVISNIISFTVSLTPTPPNSYQFVIQEFNNQLAEFKKESAELGASPTSSITFPASILVIVPVLNVRSAPSTSAPLSGSQELYQGQTFTAVNEVTGDTVDGNDLWWVSSLGNYVWSGGTSVVGNGVALTSAQGLDSADGIYETNFEVFNAGDDYLILYGNFAPSGNTIFINSAPLPASSITYQSAGQINISLGSSYQGVTFTVSVTDANGNTTPLTVNEVQTLANGSSTKMVTVGSTTYTASYSYLIDGEVQAQFSYLGQSLVERYGTAGTLSGNTITPDLSLSLAGETVASQIFNAGPKALPTPVPGYEFDTPIPGNPDQTIAVNQFNAYSTVEGSVAPYDPATLTVNSSGEVVFMNLPSGYANQQLKEENNMSVYVSGAAAVNVIAALPTSGWMASPNIDSSHTTENEYSFLSLAVTKDGSGNPTSISGYIGYSKGAISAPVNISPYITLTLGQVKAGAALNPNSLQIVNLTTPSAQLFSALVTEDGKMIDLVNAGGVAAYQYVIKTGLSGATVVVTPAGYQVNLNGTPVAAFNATGQSTSVPKVPFPAKISADELQSEIMALYGTSAGTMADVMNLATEAGYLVYETTDGTSVIVRDPITNAVVASITETNF